MTTELSTLPDTKQLENKASLAVAEAKAFAVTNPEAYQSAGAFLLGLKSILKEIDQTFDEPIRAAFQAHKVIVAAKKKHAQPIEEAERIIKGKLGAFQAAEEAKRVEAQRKAQEAARRAEEERLLMEAVDAESNGEAGEAEALLAEPVDVPFVHVESEAPKVEGISISKKWRAEVVDLMELVKAVARGEQPLTLLGANTTALNGLAKSLHAEMRVPGVKAVCEDIVSAKVG